MYIGTDIIRFQCSHLIHLRLFHTSVASLRFPSFARQFSFVGKMDPGKNWEKVDDNGTLVGVYSCDKGGLSHVGQPDSHQMEADDVSKQPKSWNFSNPTYDMEWPSLSSSVCSASKNKRTRIDFRTPLGQGSGKDLKQVKTSHIANSMKKQDDSYLPTRFAKKYMKSTTRRSYPAHAIQSRKPDHSKGLPLVEPFDICLSKRQDSGLYKNSCHSKTGEKQGTMKYLVDKNEQVLRPGMVLLKGYLALSEQVELVTKCQELGIGPGGFYQPSYQSGAKLHLQMMCLGLNWDPQTRKYDEQRPIDGSRAPGIPSEFCSLVEKAIQDSHSLIKRHFNVSNAEDILPAMSPDICIVNFYATNGRLGLHQDRDESKESLLRGLPVVSISIGDSAEFLYGDQRDVDKADKVILESGDVLIFGGRSRVIFHGVSSVIPNSAPSDLLEDANLRPGRLNLTFRKF